MNRIIIKAFNIVAPAIFFVMVFISCNQSSKVESSKVEEVTIDQKETKHLRHVVLFKFKDSATKEEIKNVEAVFESLASKIEVIREFEWGLNNSPENLNKDFTHCYFITFDSEKDREIYLPHPDHKAFGAVLGPILDDVLVIDYWTK